MFNPIIIASEIIENLISLLFFRMFSNRNDYDWESHNRRILFEGVRTLESTNASITRSNQISAETEQIGTEIISDLNEQRETLLRAKNRLTNADDELIHSRNLIKRMSRNVLYNKLILILIILLEICILIAVVYIKYFKK